MCYHISFEVNVESVIDVFPELVVDSQLKLEFPTSAYINGFSHGLQHVIARSQKDKQLHFTPMMWGYLPAWIKNFGEAEKFWTGYKDEEGKWQKGFVTLNAIGEEMLQKKLYREAALRRRCVVVVDGFYEWHHHFPIGKKGLPLKTAVKYPHYIQLQDNPHSFTMMAGIWSVWRHEEVDKETGEITTQVTPTFAIVTTAANSLMERIHNSKKRMPTILTPELAKEWLSEDLPEQRIVDIAAYQYPAEKMRAHTIPQDFQRLEKPKEAMSYPELGAEFC